MSDGYGPGGSFDEDLVRCDACGGRYQPRDVLELQGRTLCVNCKGQALARMQSGAGPVDDDGGQQTPWDRRKELGLAAAFWQTCMAVMTRPGEFFTGMDKRSEKLDCLILPAVIAFGTQAVGLLVNLAFTGLMGAATAGAGGGGGSGLDMFAMQMGVQAGTGILGLVFAPILSVVGVFIGAGIAHVILLVMKEARVPYIQTVRGYCYANCVGLVGMVPLVGPLVGGIWTLVVAVIMLMKFHRTGVWPALMAMLLLPLLCCGAAVVIAVVIGIGAAAAQ